MSDYVDKSVAWDHMIKGIDHGTAKAADIIASVTLERDRALAKLAEYEKYAGSATEAAEAIVTQWLYEIGGDIEMTFLQSETLQQCAVSALTAAYARGKAEENEACAELAENFDMEKTPVGNLPAAIRQRMGRKA